MQKVLKNATYFSVYWTPMGAIIPCLTFL